MTLPQSYGTREAKMPTRYLSDAELARLSGYPETGKAHGRHGHRAAPPDPGRTLDAPLPGCCPHCGDEVDFERWEDQYQTELPKPRPTITRFRVGVGHCRGCQARLQGRHPEQSSDALGAAGSQVGPGPRRGPLGCTTAWA